MDLGGGAYPLILEDLDTWQPLVKMFDQQLPADHLLLGYRLRMAKKQYRDSGEATVQILGREEDPIPFDGELDDTHPGSTSGAARIVADNLTAVHQAEKPVRLLLGEVVRVGLVSELKLWWQTPENCRYHWVFTPTQLSDHKDVLVAPHLETIIRPPNLAEIADFWGDLLSMLRDAADAVRQFGIPLEAYLVVAALEGTIASLVTLFDHLVLQVTETIGLVARMKGLVGMAEDGLAAAGDSCREVIDAMTPLTANESALPTVDNENSAKIMATLRVKDSVTSIRSLQEMIIAQIKATIEKEYGNDIGREHVATTGETYQSIAQQYYGDAEQWKRIWSANGRGPANLAPGTVLRIPA